MTIGRRAHVTLHPFGDQIGMHGRGATCVLADDHFVVGEHHDARRQQVALAVGDHGRTPGVVAPTPRRSWWFPDRFQSLLSRDINREGRYGLHEVGVTVRVPTARHALRRSEVALTGDGYT